jgi:hypothetical protein
VAIASLVFATVGLLLGPVGCILAIVCGHAAKSKIRGDPDRLKGDRIASAGLILGYGLALAMLLLVLAALPAVVRRPDTSPRGVCIGNMRHIDVATETWAIEKDQAQGTTADVPEVNRYIKGEATPTCPSGGHYTYGAVGGSPACSVHGRLDAAPGSRR